MDLQITHIGTFILTPKLHKKQARVLKKLHKRQMKLNKGNKQ